MRNMALFLALLILALAACGDDPEPTEIYIVVTATTAPETNTPVPPSTVLPTSPAPQPTSSTPATTTTPTVTPLPLPTNTPLPEIFPTNTLVQLPIAEQVFENGRMFWIRDTQQIWVMQALPDDPNRGDWLCYYDTFEEGEDEIDPNLIPPEGHYQPRRGFGKLWRSSEELNEGLGWALTPEFELTSNYVYIAGGTVENDEYILGPGEHQLTTLYNERISFFEEEMRGECIGGTWQKSP